VSQCSNTDRESTENTAKFEESLTIINFDTKNSNSFGQTSFINIEDALHAEFFVGKEDPQIVNQMAHSNDGINVINNEPLVIKLEKGKEQPKATCQDRDTDLQCPPCKKLCAQSCNHLTPPVNHLQMQTGEIRFKCTQCSASFAQASDIGIHLKTHAEKPFKFTQCPKSFARSNVLKSCLQTDTGEKPFKCTQCPKSFACSNVFQIHLRTHTSYPFKCLECQECFANSSELTNHKQTHTIEKEKCQFCSCEVVKGTLKMHQMHTCQFKINCCPECPSYFNQPSHLRSHLRTHEHEHTTYQHTKCEFCSCEVQNAMLEFHQMFVCKNNSYCCPECPLKLATKQSLWMHLEKKHGKKC
jgi:KRAB domain-containing zinc finger protein